MDATEHVLANKKGAAPNVSVLICTRDRHTTIRQAVESVAQCDYPAFDIHIMDQSTTDETAGIIEQLKSDLGSSAQIHYAHLSTPGLSRSYNAGVKQSDGEIVALTDDDCIVPRDWLAKIVRAFTEDEHLGVLFGQVAIPADLCEQVAQGVEVPSLSIPKRVRMYRGGFFVFGMGANMAVRRSIFTHVGGFDEMLGGGGPLRSSQDFDLMFRIYRAGSAVLLDPEVTVDHYGTRNPDQWPDTMRNYGIGDGAFYSKHVRCGDPLAFWLLATRMLRSKARSWRDKAQGRPDTQYDLYLASIWNGIRKGREFSVDRKHRLYVANGDARAMVTESNRITSTIKGG